MNKNDQKVSQKLLNKILANQTVLLIQTLNYHWNVVGKEFHDYHLLLDKQYNMLFLDLDLVAERVRAVGGIALGSMKNILINATLKEDSGDVPDAFQMIQNLLQQYELLILQIYEAIVLLESKTKDFGTRKMLEDLIEKYEKMAWMLRALTGKQ